MGVIFFEVCTLGCFFGDFWRLEGCLFPVVMGTVV